MPSPTVTISFDLSANGLGDFFTLDDTTKGVLDQGTYLYAGDVAQDVTGDVRKISTRRGRSKQLDRFTAGACTVTLDNRTRKYDPTAGTAQSPYAGQITPGKAVTVAVAGQPVYAGIVQDWNLSYEISGDSTTDAVCADGFSLLAQTVVPVGTATAQATGARIGAYLTTLGWPTALRSIGTGQATLLADIIKANQNGLQYLQKVEASEPGALFIGKDGAMVFRDRLQVQAWNGVTFADDGTGIPFTDLEVEYGTETLFTSTTVTRSNGSATVGTATSTNASAQTAYGRTNLSIDTLLSSDAQASNLSAWLLGKYQQPQYRVRQLKCTLDALNATQAGQLLDLELADVVKFVFTPNQVGSPITQYLIIDSIAHDITPSRHEVTLDVSDTQIAFTLDSAVFGVLDQNIYGF